MELICARLCERIGLGHKNALLGLPLDEMWASVSQWHASIVNVTSPSMHSSSIPFSRQFWEWDQRAGIGDETVATWYVSLHWCLQVVTKLFSFLNRHEYVLDCWRQSTSKPNTVVWYGVGPKGIKIKLEHSRKSSLYPQLRSEAYKFVSFASILSVHQTQGLQQRSAGDISKRTQGVGHLTTGR
jgi:hypothetical protein